MRFLVVDDNGEKAKELITTFNYDKSVVKIIENEKDTKDLLKNDKEFNFILLDMAFPKSRIGSISANKYGGINILNFMKIYNIDIPVIVTSIYWDFISLNKPEAKLADRIYYNKHFNDKQFYEKYFEYENFNNIQHVSSMNNLEELHELMANRYSNYVGSIQYSDVNHAWKSNMKKLMEEKIENEK